MALTLSLACFLGKPHSHQKSFVQPALVLSATAGVTEIKHSMIRPQMALVSRLAAEAINFS